MKNKKNSKYYIFEKILIWLLILSALTGIYSELHGVYFAYTSIHDPSDLIISGLGTCLMFLIVIFFSYKKYYFSSVVLVIVSAYMWLSSYTFYYASNIYEAIKYSVISLLPPHGDQLIIFLNVIFALLLCINQLIKYFKVKKHD